MFDGHTFLLSLDLDQSFLDLRDMDTFWRQATFF